MSPVLDRSVFFPGRVFYGASTIPQKKEYAFQVSE